MWIEELPNGKYKFVERYTDPLTAKDRKVSITMDKKTKQAEKQAYKILTERIERKLGTEFTDSFSNLLDRWFDVYKQSVKASTLSNVSSRINVIKEQLGDVQMEQMSPQIINRFLLHSLTEGNRSYRTVNGDKSIILRSLKFGVQHGYCEDKSYNLLVETPELNKTKKDNLKYLEQHELSNLYQRIEEDNDKLLLRMVKIQVNTGMRFNEMMALKISDIDFMSNSIHIQRNFDSENRMFTTPKTGDDRLSFYPSALRPVLEEQITHSKLATIKYNLPRDNDLLFKSRTGLPYDIRGINRKLAKYDTNGKHISTHIFRHTFITMKVEEGMDLNLIAKQVGHSSQKMIQQVYSHFTESMSESLKQLISNSDLI